MEGQEREQAKDAAMSPIVPNSNKQKLKKKKKKKKQEECETKGKEQQRTREMETGQGKSNAGSSMLRPSSGPVAAPGAGAPRASPAPAATQGQAGSRGVEAPSRDASATAPTVSVSIHHHRVRGSGEAAAGANASDSSPAPLLAYFPAGAPAALLQSLKDKAGGESLASQDKESSRSLRFRVCTEAEALGQGGEEGRGGAGGEQGRREGERGEKKVLLGEIPHPQVSYVSQLLGQGVLGSRSGGGKGGSGAASVPPCQVHLALFNKRTNSLHLLPTEVCSMRCRLKPQGAALPGPADAEANGPAAAPAEAAATAGAMPADSEAAARRRVIEQQNLLTAAFGTKKQKRMMESIERSRAATSGGGEGGRGIEAAVLEAAAAAPAALAAVEAGERGPGGEQRQQAVSKGAALAAVRNIPPHNLSATAPAEAYPVSLLVPEEEWEATDAGLLLQAANESRPVVFLRQASKRGEGPFPQLVFSRLRCLTAVGLSAGARVWRARCLMHITYLYRFLKSHPTLKWNPNAGKGQANGTAEGDEGGVEGEGEDAVLSTEVQGLPSIESIAQHLRAPLATTARLVRMFAEISDGGSAGVLEYQRPAGKRDLLVETLLLLCLHVDSFDARLSGKACASDLHVMPKQLVQYLREMGCRVVRLKFKAKEGTKKRKRGAESSSQEGTGLESDTDEVYGVTLPMPLQLPELRKRRQVKL